MLLLDDVWRLSGASVSLMSQIPASHIDTADLNSFVVRLGDYAHGLTKKAVRGIPMTEEDQAQLTELHNACIRIGAELNERLAVGMFPLRFSPTMGISHRKHRKHPKLYKARGRAAGNMRSRRDLKSSQR